MKKNLYIALTISVLSIMMWASCSKKEATPQICPLSGITNAKGNILERLTYDANNRLISDVGDSTGLGFDFTYNAQNLVDKITVTDKTAKKTLTFVVTFSYDANNKLTKSVTTFNGSVFQTDVFTYNGSKVSNILSTDAGGETDAIRFEYTNDNIAKVYQKLDKDKEYLYYEVTAFDTYRNTYPEAFKMLALGLSGLVDDFSFLNVNNPLSERYYSQGGKLASVSNNVFEYNSNLQPTKETSTVIENGKKSTAVTLYQYTCN